jgi:hypothetical protein
MSLTWNQMNIDFLRSQGRSTAGWYGTEQAFNDSMTAVASDTPWSNYLGGFFGKAATLAQGATCSVSPACGAHALATSIAHPSRIIRGVINADHCGWDRKAECAGAFTLDLTLILLARTATGTSGAATNTVNGLSIKGLMGSEGDVVVLGRQVDTAVAKDWAGHVVLDTPKWNLAVNDAFISETIAQGRSVYLATPLEGNLVQTAGQYAGQPTIYARELEQLVNAGYRRVGDYMVPSGG